MVAQPEPDRREQLLAAREAIRRQQARVSFPEFLKVWRFQNRETGEVLNFGDALWPGQQRLVQAMLEHPWLLALKAGKLGFTELECAWDGWVALFGRPYGRVHLFSKNGEAARDLLGYVRFGLTHLPPALAPTIMADKPGGDTVRSIRLKPPAWAQADAGDIRTVMSYNADKRPSVDQSAQHAHIDEVWAMPFPHDTYSAVATTVAPGGSLHVVSRGGGQGSYTTTLWEKAVAGEAADEGEQLFPFFEGWEARGDRDRAWYEVQQRRLTHEQLARYAPVTVDDAIYSTDISAYLPLAAWDRCYDPDLPPFVPGLAETAIIACDAGYSHDCFGIAVATRHPERPLDPAIRAVRLWVPPPGGQIDFEGPEDFLRWVVLGGCFAGHHRRRTGATLREGEAECVACVQGEQVPPHNVYGIVYDVYQLHDMMTRLRRELGISVREFPQTKDRAIADRQLFDLAISGRLAHNGDPALREHIGNAAAKTQKGEESKMRIVKIAEDKKVDLAVCASMACHEVLRLFLSPRG